MTDDSEQLLRDVATTASCGFHTTAPYAIGTMQVARVGCASIPVCQVTVHCRPEDTATLVPITRALVYQTLEEQGGIPSDVLAISPRVTLERDRVVFTDENPDSPSCGKQKRGARQRYSFEIKAHGLNYFEFGYGTGRVRPGAG